MRICIITATPLETIRGSGTARAVQALAQALRLQGFDICWLTPRRPFLWFTFDRIEFNLWLRRQVRRLAPDCVIGIDMDGWLVAREPRRWLHIAAPKGILADEARFERGWTALSMRLQAACERWHVRWANRTIVPSRYSKTRLAELYGVAFERIGVIPEAFDIDGWCAKLRAAPRRGSDEFRVLTVARFYPRKDLGTLLRAATRTRGMEFRIVGDGPERRKLHRCSRNLHLDDRVRWLGNVSEEQLADEYSACAVFCLPSRQEAFGLVLVEAMVAGKPIVAARAASVPELVQDGYNGLLVEPGDFEGVAEALERLRRDPVLRARLGAAGRIRAEQFALGRVGKLWAEEIGLLQSERQVVS